MDNNKDHYSPLTLLCRLQDVLAWAHYATDTDRMGDGHKARGKQLVEELYAVYGERRYIPDQPS